jgi:hypothetical protein
MIFEEGHPVISREHWLEFRNFQLAPTSLRFSGRVNREDVDLPYWFLPLSRGALIAGPGLLGPHYDASLASRGWTRRSADVYERKIGKTRLRVRRTNDGRFWLISRWLPGVPMHSDRRSETIVDWFGSTPLVTTNLHEALYLAHWFQTNKEPGLHWSKASPHYLVGAIRLANERAQSEGVTISWNDLWASAAHSRRMKSGRARYRNGKLLPPVWVRPALRTNFQG